MRFPPMMACGLDPNCWVDMIEKDIPAARENAMFSHGPFLRWSAAIGLIIGIFLASKIMKVDVFTLVGGRNPVRALFFGLAVALGSAIGLCCSWCIMAHFGPKF